MQASSKQRGFGLVVYLIAAGVLAAVIGGLFWQWVDFKEGLREEGRAEVRAEWQADRARLIAARDAMVMRWAAAVQNVERVYIEKVVEREKTFTGVRERAGRINVAGGIRLDAAAVGVLRDVERAANAAEPAAAAGPGDGADLVSEPAGSEAVDTSAADWVAFAIDAGERFRQVDDARLECVAMYEAAREAVGKISEGKP
jgi:hypothetical protein